jgi:hypothetical protein
MKEFEVEMIGMSREVYIVRAESPEDAAHRWYEGQLVLSEASSMELGGVREASA